MTDSTHDAALRSWVESANHSATDFPIQNLPFGVFLQPGHRLSPGPYVGVAIGDQILNLADCAEHGMLNGLGFDVKFLKFPSLNALMALPDAVRNLRRRVSLILRDGSADAALARGALVAQKDVQMLRPARIGDYTDFYASLHHATNVGSMFRPDNPLLPNYKWIPIGYHGRASSIVLSGTTVRRPLGQTRDGEQPPQFGSSKRLDYEMEIGAFIGLPNQLGETIKIGDAERHIFGFCLVNDWSARDIQTWEYQPLGPFLAKNFATSISPWVVTLDALEPYRVPAFERAEGDPAPLPYLDSQPNRERGGIDINVEVLLQSAQMRQQGLEPLRLSRSNYRHMYWTMAQMVAHHASNGCNLQSGDLLASGTISGPEKDSRGCLLELTWRGTEPVSLPSGETRRFLEDGDEIIMRGWCEREGFARIGFGECRGIISPAESV